MKRSHLKVGSLTRWFVHRAPTLLLACLVGCGGTESPTETPITLLPGDLCSAFPSTAIATFEDAVVRDAVRAWLELSAQEDLTCGLVAGLTNLTLGLSPNTQTAGSLLGMQNLTNLTLFFAIGGTSQPALDLSPLSGLTRLTILQLSRQAVSDISALAGLTNLTSLILEGNSISDISALSGLTNLTELVLAGSAELTDISPLSGLTSLTHLDFGTWEDALGISDISPLNGLTSLTWLGLRGNYISDINALSGLTSLVQLELGGNSISDISALSGFTSLKVLNLGGNSALSDIASLLANPGLGVGDEVDLGDTGVSCLDVARLEFKGVEVSSDC